MTLIMASSVWTVLVPGDAPSFTIPEYFEWRNDDTVMVYKTIPMVKVTPQVAKSIVDGYGDIPKEIYEAISGLSQTSRDFKQKGSAFIINDGEKAVVIDTLYGNKPDYKGHLIPKKARNLVDAMEPLLPMDIKLGDSKLAGENLSVEPEYAHNKKDVLKLFYELSSKHLVGLTRRERELKELLFQLMYGLTAKYNAEEVYYWYTDLFPNRNGKSEDNDKETYELLVEMFNRLAVGWDDSHEKLLEGLIKTDEVVQSVWEGIQSKYKDVKLKGTKEGR